MATETADSPTKETNFTDDEGNLLKPLYLQRTILICNHLDLNEIELNLETANTLKKAFKIRPDIIQKDNFELDLPFTLMEAFSSRPVGILIYMNLNEKQKLAHACLKTHLRQLFLNKFNRKMTIHTFYKSTNLKYRVKMNCTKRYCNFYWTIIFNIKSKKVSVIDNGTICDHFVDSNGNFY